MSTRSYDFGKAVFHFFHIAGKKPVAVLWIALWQALLMGGLAYLAWITFGDMYIWLIQTAASGVEPDEAEIISRMSSVMGLMPLISIGGMLIALMAEAAWLRLLTRQEIAPVFPFRLGSDELHLFVTNLGLIAIGIGMYLIFLFLMIFVGVGMLATLSGGGGAEAGMVTGLFVVIGFFVAISISIFVSVRVSAAPAMSILEKRIAFPAWGATKGVFWPVFGSYIVTGILIFFLSAIVGLILNFTVFGAFWPMISEFVEMAQAGQEPDPEQVFATLGETLSSSGTIATLVAAGLLAVILRSFVDAIWHGVGAYTALSTQTPPTAEVSD